MGTTKTKLPKYPELVLNVRVEEPGSYCCCHLKGWMSLRGDRCLYLSDEEEGGKFSGFIFNAQTDYDHLVRENVVDLMYGYKLEWKGDYNDLRSLKAGVKALTYLEREMQKLYEKAGPAASFGAWVQRVAVCIGVGGVKMSNHPYTDHPENCSWRIDGKIKEWQEKARKYKGLEVAV